MSKTTRLKLPLLQPSQAQKHITVNEALSLLDSFVQLQIHSLSTTTPPSSNNIDGDVYAVPNGASQAWSGKDGALAVFSNGGWIFITPETGWRAWVLDQKNHYTYKNSGWTRDVLSTGSRSAGLNIDTFDHTIPGGTVHNTTKTIAAGSLVFAITGRVLQTITGSLTRWRIGVTDNHTRYGTDLSTVKNTPFAGVTNRPIMYTKDTPLRIAADGGDFTGGGVRLSVHFMTFAIPSAQ